MSREHAIYTQGPLNAMKTTTSAWSGTFSESSVSGSGKGGLLVEGEFKGRQRHIITDGTGERHRFQVVFVRPAQVIKRQFLADGTEVEYATEKSKIIKTGYLRTSHQKVQTAESGEITVEAARPLLASSLPSCGGPADCFEVWCREDVLSRIELVEGEWLRLKTRGDRGNVVDTITKLDQRNVHVSNHAGDSGSSWLNNIKPKDERPLPQDKLEGTPDSDWD